ncbi:MAG TPA: DoxX family protein [Alphaproteobacteria bacterium]
MSGGAIESRRLIIPALGRIYEALSPYSYAFMRFCTGAVLVPHGWQKLFHGDIGRAAAGVAAHGLPAPLLLAYAVVFTEFFSAALLAIGLLTRFAALTIVIQMAVITFVWQWPNGYFWTDRGYEFPLLWMLLCIAIFFRGGGRYSLDRLIGWEL